MENRSIKIDNITFRIINYNEQIVLTTEQLACIYDTNVKNIRKNFERNKTHFKKNFHYYKIEGEDLKKFKEIYKDTDIVSKHSSSLYLWTERGANRHCKILDTKKAWQQFDKLEEIYFTVKDIIKTNNNLQPKNEFDIMRMLINQMEEIKYGVEKLENIQNEQNNKIKNIEDKIDVVKTINDVSASDIAHQLHLYSTSGLVHSNLIGAIVRKLKFKVNYKHWYQDEYIKIIGDKQDINNGYWQVYYTPLAASMIIKWFNTNKDKIYYKELYKAGPKKGQKKCEGYRINGVFYKINMK